ncbi:MAG: primosomal protein N' [Alphaproteobacteria bacterium]|mgnify:CR=1 FL=1|nr:primosomal protein N' [Alphaproteobacteria bacterium]
MPLPDTTAPQQHDTANALSVLLPLPVVGPYDYLAPEGMDPAPGDYVHVPLGSRELIGVVWGPAAGDVSAEKLRPITERIDTPAMPEELRRFVDWVAAYTLSAPGAVLRMALRSPEALQPPKPITAYKAGALQEDMRMTPARARVLELLRDGPPRTARDLSREAGVGTSVIKGLAKMGAVVPIELAPPPAFDAPDIARPGLALSEAQSEAAIHLRAGVEADGFSVTLLDGVTGSGKTEVYFEAVAGALSSGRQVLVLLPEIALTPQWLERFERRFGTAPAVWHSDLGQTQRRTTWRSVARGEARVVVGARSALFLPYTELGLVVVDEEHETAFKQEDGVAYNGRDMAIVRAQIADCPVVVASATPSLETRINVERDRYKAIALPERFGSASMPMVETVDMRDSELRADQFLSPQLIAALSQTTAEGEQALLFLNRRGYAPLTLCRTCGHRMACPSCSAWLTEHRFRKRLQCHHCGYEEPAPTRCPSCDNANTMVACGPGVERIAEEVRAQMPDARMEIMTSDTMRGPDTAQRLVRAVEDKEIDVLIGTQMVAKGHHFPNLTLVGIVDADLGLAGGDLRAAERTYQVLQQVAGRAGRADRPGRVMIQTFQPEHPVMQALATGERDRFMELEAEAREAGGWPPFGRLAAIIVSSRDSDLADALARDMARCAPNSPEVRVLGPAPAPLSLLRGRHRRRLLLKTGRDQPLQAIVREWLSTIKVPSKARVRVDIDPYSFL